MQKINSISELKMAIQFLESRQELEWALVKNEFHATSQRLSPAKLISHGIQDLISTPDFKKKAIGLATGMIAEKIFVGESDHPLKKILGFALGMTLTKQVSEHADEIKSIGSLILQKIVNPNP